MAKAKRKKRRFQPYVLIKGTAEALVKLIDTTLANKWLAWYHSDNIVRVNTRQFKPEKQVAALMCADWNLEMVLWVR